MLALRHGERALPLAWRVEATAGPIGFEVQKELLEAVAPWLPERVLVSLMTDRFYGTADLISLCQGLGWGYRLRLKGNLVVGDRGKKTKTGALADGQVFPLECVQLTAEKATTNIGIIRDPGHDEAWIIAMSDKPGYAKTLDYPKQSGIEPMFSDFKSRGFGVEHMQLQYPDRLACLLLVMAIALYCAVSTGLWNAEHHPVSTEKTPEPTAQEGRALKNVLVHSRPAPHYQASPSRPATSATLVNATDGWSGCSARH